MACVSKEESSGCGDCEAGFPTEAISEGDPKYTIDAGTCIDCGACVGECPSNAIAPE